MTVITRNYLTSPRSCGKDACRHRFCYDVFFAVVIHAALARFGEDPGILRDLVHL